VSLSNRRIEGLTRAPQSPSLREIQIEGAPVAKRLTYFILAGLVLGIVVGWAINSSVDDGSPEAAERLKTIAGYFSILTTVFLNLIKMIIAPLVLSTMVVGIAHMGDTSTLGRVGLKAFSWFVCASLV
jgi:Na+/H+-dicarboxylate symporter